MAKLYFITSLVFAVLFFREQAFILFCFYFFAQTILFIKFFKSYKRFFHQLNERTRNKEREMRTLKNSRKALFECLTEGVVILDAEQKILEMNQKAAKFLGKNKCAMVGYKFEKSEIPQVRLFEKCRALLARSSAHLSIMSDTIEDQNVHLEIMVIPIGKEEGSILIFHDNSSNFKVLEMGKEFVANASHELRTPITIIKGFAETLRDLEQISEGMLEEIIDKIVRNCQRMNNLVKNLLLLTDLDHLSRARMQRRELIPIIENCCHNLLSVHQEAHIETLFNKESIQISADADLFEQAIYNLLENAVKYSSSPAHITILMEEKPSLIQIQIQDRGKGIAKKDLPQIFDRFYTVNKAHSRKLGGAGLGLSIVKTIIEKHDGNIEALSEVGKGTTFQITLPL